MAGPKVGGHRDDRAEYALDRLPAVRGHAELFLIWRYSHASPSLSSRPAEDRDTRNASATSSTVNPPKWWSSIIRHLRGSKLSSAQSASSRASIPCAFSGA